jgi:hypothetical protein
LQWLQDPSEIDGDNLNNIRLEACRQFRNKKREYLKDKIRRIRWAWHVGRMGGEKECIYDIDGKARKKEITGKTKP